MFIIMSKKKYRESMKSARDEGFNKGWDLRKLYDGVSQRNLEFCGIQFIKPIDKELDDILRDCGF